MTSRCWSAVSSSPASTSPTSRCWVPSSGRPPAIASAKGRSTRRETPMTVGGEPVADAFALQSRIAAAARGSGRAGRRRGSGQPNWTVTEPRAAFFRLGLFATQEADRHSTTDVWGEMPPRRRDPRAVPRQPGRGHPYRHGHRLPAQRRRVRGQRARVRPRRVGARAGAVGARVRVPVARTGCSRTSRRWRNATRPVHRFAARRRPPVRRVRHRGWRGGDDATSSRPSR